MATKTESKKNEVAKAQLHELRLSTFELQHIRDLFSIMLPPDLKMTISQALATAENRVLVETKLWNKIAALCTAADVPLGDAAPDFVIAPTGPPPLNVFQLAQSQSQIIVNDDNEPEKERLIFG